MEDLSKFIEQATIKSKIEKRTNVVYCVKHSDEEVKTEVKKLFIQGNPSEDHTVVEIDFVKEKQKISRKKKFIMKKQNKTPIFDSYPVNDNEPFIKIYNSPIYIYGEYIKLSREMSQTPLNIGGEMKTERSVSDFTREFKMIFDADDVKFMSCGREDIDVRCLEGRPFVLEIISPKKNLDKNQFRISLYKDVDIINTYKVLKRCKEIINNDESFKFYKLDFFSEKQIFFESIYKIQQKTPLRVLHRRANLIKEKIIEILEHKQFLDPEGFYYELSIRASSGAYIKEWINGDFQRTLPNFNSEILSLDVLRVEKEFDRSTIIDKIDLEKHFVDKYCDI